MNCEVRRATLPDRLKEDQLQRYEQLQCMDPHATVCNHRPAAQHVKCKTQRQALCFQLLLQLGETAVASAQRPCITETGDFTGLLLCLICIACDWSEGLGSVVSPGETAIAPPCWVGLWP
jgi:hypothetical protein